MAHFPPVGAIGDLARRVGRTDISGNLNDIVAGRYGREVAAGASLSRDVRTRFVAGLKTLRADLNKQGYGRMKKGRVKNGLRALNP